MIPLSQFVVRPVALVKSGHYLVVRPQERPAILGFMTKHPEIGPNRRIVALAVEGKLIEPTLLQLNGDQHMACDLERSLEIVASPISAMIEISGWVDELKAPSVVRTGTRSGLQARSNNLTGVSIHAYSLEDGTTLVPEDGYVCFREWELIVRGEHGHFTSLGKFSG